MSLISEKLKRRLLFKENKVVNFKCKLKGKKTKNHMEPIGLNNKVFVDSGSFNVVMNGF